VTERMAGRLVKALAAYLIVAVAAAIWLTAGDRTSSLGDAPFVAMLAGGLTTFATIGLVIAAKAPQNPIGWLYAAGGIGMITGLTANEYAIRVTGSTLRNEFSCCSTSKPLRYSRLDAL